MPNRGINMGDGWETRRSRIPGKSSVTNKKKIIIINHYFFKFNYLNIYLNIRLL